MSSMPKGVRREAPGSHGVARTLPLPQREQLALRLDGEAQLKSDEERDRASFRAAVQAFGGPDALRAALGERETYLSKITDALVGTRPVQSRWRLPLLRDPRAAMVLLHHDAELAGAEPPVFAREVGDDEIARAAVEVLAESGQMRETFRSEIAKRLGVRIEAVRL